MVLRRRVSFARRDSRGCRAPADRQPATVIDYYRDVLGLHVVERAVDSVGLSASGSDRPLVWLYAKAGIKPAPRRGAFGLYHFAILLPDSTDS